MSTKTGDEMNKQDTVDEILSHLRIRKAWPRPKPFEEQRPTVRIVGFKKVKAALSQHYLKEALEIIGEDAKGAKYDGGDPIDCDECGCYVHDEAPSCACDVQNQLRAELRTLFTERWGGDNHAEQ